MMGSKQPAVSVNLSGEGRHVERNAAWGITKKRLMVTKRIKKA